MDKNTELAVRLKVMGVPTFVLYRDGREQWRHPGTLTKSELHAVLERHII
jgi:thioredoxin 1